MADQSQPDTTHSLNRVEEEVKGPAVERQLQLVLTHRGLQVPPGGAGSTRRRRGAEFLIKEPELF